MKRTLGCIVLGLATMAASAQWTNPAEDIPAYNAKPPIKPLKPILSGSQLTGEYFSHPYQVIAYQIAAKIPAVLHQQPCYCHCDRAMGHNSLHSCFEGTHGATCSTCMKEAVYSYEQTKKGKLLPRSARPSNAASGRQSTWNLQLSREGGSSESVRLPDTGLLFSLSFLRFVIPAGNLRLIYPRQTLQVAESESP